MFNKQKIDTTFIFFLFLYLLNIYLKFNGLIIIYIMEVAYDTKQKSQLIKKTVEILLILHKDERMA